MSSMERLVRYGGGAVFIDYGAGCETIEIERCRERVRFVLRDGVREDVAREAFRLAAAKLPLRTIFVQRHLG